MTHSTTLGFQIVVAGAVDTGWPDWFEGTVLERRNGPDRGLITILTGEVSDQAALRGLLNRLWDQNLSLLSYRRITSAAADATAAARDTGRSDD